MKKVVVDVLLLRTTCTRARRNQAYAAKPPSSGNATPVINAACGEQR
jgi:hypothetical protein